MQTLKVVLFSVLVLAQQPGREPRKVALSLTNGDSQRNGTTYFVSDAEVSLFAQTLGSKGYEVTSVTELNERRFNESVDRMLEQVKTGKLTTGDQVVIQVAGHGSERMPGQQTHFIAGTDKGVSMDRLKELSDAMASSGIRLAIVDLSCFSGTMQPLANDTTCVISSSQPDEPAYFRDYMYNRGGKVVSSPQSFGTQFWQRARSAENIEDAFLDARRSRETFPAAGDYTVVDRPMISTMASAMTDQIIESRSRAEIPSGPPPEGPLCERMASLEEQADQLRAIANRGIADNLAGFRGQFQGLQKQMDGVLDELIIQRLEVQGQFGGGDVTKDSCAKPGEHACPATNANCPEMEKLIKACDSPAGTELLALEAKLDAVERKMQSLSTVYGASERALYDDVYRSVEGPSVDRNACSDFKL